MLKPLRISRPSLLLVAGASAAFAGCGRDAMFDLQRPALVDDAGLDGGVPDGDLPDGFVPDGFVPDGFVPDASVPDGFVPDATLPDTSIIDTGVPDTGFPDATTPDFGFPDGAVPDTGFPDATTPDFGFPDGSIFDTGVPDVGFPDGAVPDVGFPDATIPDLGFPDGAVPDVGFPDANVPDSGVPCPMGCAFLDDDCNVGICAPDGVTCVRRPLRNGTPCDDGDACTVASTCNFGTCQGGVPVDCSAFDDACNVGACDVTTGQCQANPVPDGTICDDNVVCTDSSCQMGSCVGVPLPPPPGDTCTTALPVVIAPGPQVQTGSNECATDSNQGSCGGSFAGGAELIYSTTFAETRRIRLETVTPSSGAPSYDTVLYMNEGVCGPAPTPTTPICDDDSGQGFLSLVDEVFAPGTWFINVDAFGANARGEYELMIDVDPHDTCANPSVIEIPALGQTNTIVGNTTGNANDFQADCAGQAQSPDHVYTFTVQARTLLRFETVAPTVGQRYDTALHIRQACVPGNVGVIACDDDAGDFTLSRIERTFDPGTYFLMVDGFSTSSAGEYQLEVTQLPPLTPLIFPATGDARQPLTGGFTSAGEFVEGIRTPGVNSASRMEIDLQVTNNLTCGVASFLVRLNNTQVGFFTIRPGDASVSQTFNFPQIFGPSGRFNIRYEMRASIPSTCGNVVLPDDISTVGLGN